jgi:hypothetical protein
VDGSAATSTAVSACEAWLATTMQPPSAFQRPVTVSPPETAHTVRQSQCLSTLAVRLVVMPPPAPWAA